MKTIACPECGELLTINPDEVELFTRLVCEGCYTTLEITSDDPIELAVVEVDPDELDDDDYDEDEDEDD
jgi:DNA-directed RNA polymerase subunit M/transcription elongation factor TFIIS